MELDLDQRHAQKEQCFRRAMVLQSLPQITHFGQCDGMDGPGKCWDHLETREKNMSKGFVSETYP